MGVSKFIAPAVGIAIAIAAPLGAQQEDGDTIPIPLQTVYVDVLRTPFPVTSAPFGITVKTEDEMQRARQGLGLKDALGGIPGVQIDNRYNYAQGDRVSIRGFGARTPFGVRGVTVLVDGIPATLPDGTTNLNHLDLGFLSRAEVIRGPASSLYGNAAGGVIQFETERAPSAPISEEVGIVGGSHGLLRFSSTTGGTTGRTEYLLNVSRLTYDGWRPFQEASNVQVNASVGLPVAGGELRFIGSFVDYSGNNPGSLNQAQLDANRDTTIAIYLNHKTSEDGRQGQLGASWRGAVGSGQLELASYGLTRDIRNPIPFNLIDLSRVGGGMSAIYRSSDSALTSGFGWAVGAEADVQADERLNYDISFPGDISEDPAIDQNERVLAGAVFAQLSAVPSPRLTATAGVRFDATRFRAEDHLVSALDPDDSGERTMNAFSPSVGVSYELSDGLSLYGNVATSFETPTTTELANQETGAGGFNPDLDPQRTLSFEAGFKGQLAARAAWQLSAFRANVEDALVQFTVLSNPDRVFFRNAGSVVHQGVEAGLTVVPFEGLRADFAYTWVDARFDEYVSGNNDFSDNLMPGLSPHRFDGSLTYTAPFGGYASLDARYADAMPVNDANTASAPAYTLVDARLGLQELRLGGIAIEPFVGATNLFDEEYITSPSVNHSGGRYFEPGPGRAFYIGGQVRAGGN